MKNTAIILGDSFNNTLGLIRSLGEAGGKIVLILAGKDRLFIRKSRYVSVAYKCRDISEVGPILKKLTETEFGAYLIASNDKAAKWIDENESWLSTAFRTPMSGATIGKLFNKPVQISLAENFNITVPKSVIYQRGESFPARIPFPILLKPTDSNSGTKGDIHICRTHDEVLSALQKDSSCTEFIVQEYIEKDYEINLIGISTQAGVIIPGGIKKIRHYPTLYSPCSFGLFTSVQDLDIDVQPIKSMISATGYKGPFSIEFVRRGDRDYFMEINFRHDGLAYAATASGVNLLEMYLKDVSGPLRVNPTYMMDLSTDYCHVKDGNLKKSKWLNDFIHTRCQLNFNLHDPMPTIFYYLSKVGLMKGE